MTGDVHGWPIKRRCSCYASYSLFFTALLLLMLDIFLLFVMGNYNQARWKVKNNQRTSVRTVNSVNTRTKVLVFSNGFRTVFIFNFLFQFLV